MREAANDWR